MIGVFVQVGSRIPVGYVLTESGCWEWVGTRDRYGYGSFAVKGRMCIAHRVMYERLVGPIPEGLQLDHLCLNKSCVNPAHLEPVTQRENLLRADGWAGTNGRKTHCLRGHEFTADNTRIETDGSRKCRTCDRARGLRRPKHRNRKRFMTRIEP